MSTPNKTIRTRYASHPSTGAGQIIATAGHRRLVMEYDHARGAGTHADAALSLAERLGWVGEVTEGETNRDGSILWNFVPASWSSQPAAWSCDGRVILLRGMPLIRCAVVADSLAPSEADDLVRAIVDALNKGAA